MYFARKADIFKQSSLKITKQAYIYTVRSGRSYTVQLYLDNNSRHPETPSKVKSNQSDLIIKEFLEPIIHYGLLDKLSFEVPEALTSQKISNNCYKKLPENIIEKLQQYLESIK